MDYGIYEKLPDHHRRIVDEVEAVTGFEIMVIPETDLSKFVPGNIFDSGAGNEPSAVVNLEHAIIVYTGDENALSYDDYYHELLHIRRYHVENTPVLIAKDPKNGNLAATIENEFEHRYIYEQHFLLSQVAKDRGEREHKEAWERYPWHISGTALNLYTLMRYWRARTLFDIKMIGVANRAVGLKKDKLRMLTDRMERAKANKAKAISLLLRFMNLPTSAFFLRTFDTKNGRNVDTEIDA